MESLRRGEGSAEGLENLCETICQPFIRKRNSQLFKRTSSDVVKADWGKKEILQVDILEFWGRVSTRTNWNKLAGLGPFLP